MKTLVLTDGIFGRIAALAREYEGLEFAVTLFGHRDLDRYVVTHMADPGSRAKHAWGFCTGDDEFETSFFAKLRQERPDIQWLGDLHMHPPRYPMLSGIDRLTIKRILLGTDETVHPEEYIAGIMLPRRRRGEPGLAIFPNIFSKQNLEGSEMELEYVNAGVCKKSERTRGSFKDARVGGWLRHAWRWLSRYAGPGWRGEAHAD